MAQYKVRTIVRALTCKGFDPQDRKGHIHFYLNANGRPTGIHTFISKGSKGEELGDSLLGEMAKQIHLTRQQFKDLIDCPMSSAELVDILTTGGWV